MAIKFINNEQIEFFKQLPYCYEFYMSGNLVRILHSSPQDLFKDVLFVDKPSVKIHQFEPTKNTISDKYADIVIYGHVHNPFMEKFCNRTLINAGSVGNPIDPILIDNKLGNRLLTTKSSYLIIEGIYGSKNVNDNFSVQFINLSYNMEEELENQKGNIDYDNYKYELENGLYSNMNNIDKILKGKI